MLIYIHDTYTHTYMIAIKFKKPTHHHRAHSTNLQPEEKPTAEEKVGPSPPAEIGLGRVNQ